jgi:hypothetical protein
VSRGVQMFKQTDVKKAAAGARSAGLEIQRIEIDRSGKIVIVTGAPGAQPSKIEDVADLI